MSNMGVSNDISAGFRRLIVNQSEVAKKSRVSQPSISRYAKGELGAEGLLRVLDFFGARLVFPDEDPSREVVFINPRIHQDHQALPRPVPEDYRAIPLTNMEVAAGPGLNTQSEPELMSWVLVYVQELAARRSRLTAARVGVNQKSMLPGIQPGDIVVIDLDDKNIQRPGIFLVRDPEEGVALKRVKYFIKRGKSMLTFYSDNAAEGYEPSTYALDEFDHDLSAAVDKAIVGRCIWQWGDLEKR